MLKMLEKDTKLHNPWVIMFLSTVLFLVVGGFIYWSLNSTFNSFQKEELALIQELQESIVDLQEEMEGLRADVNTLKNQ